MSSLVIYLVLAAISTTYLWLGITSGSSREREKAPARKLVPVSADDAHSDETDFLDKEPAVTERSRKFRFINPFYNWLFGALRNPQYFSIATLAGLILAAISLPPLVVDVFSRLGGNASETVYYDRYSLFFNFAVTVAAIIWITRFKRAYNASGLERLLHTVQRLKPLQALSMNGPKIAPAIVHAIKTGKEITTHFMMLYFSIAVLYGALLVQSIWLPEDRVIGVLAVAINYLSVHYLALVYLKLTYSEPTHYKVKGRIRWVDGLLIVFSIINIYAGTHELKMLDDATEGLSGLMVGVTFCLMIGKLDSLMIRTPTSILYALYCYAVLQILFVAFDMLTGDLWLLSLRYCALILKIIMYVYFAWLLSKDRLILHLIFSQVLDEKVMRDIKEMESAFEMGIHEIPMDRRTG